MKNFALCAKSLMLILAVPGVSCSDNGSADATKTETKVESAPAVTLNIRYIDGDSIAAHYNLAKDFKEAQLRSFSKIDNAQRTRGAELQKLGSSIQQKVNNNGYLSEASYKADVESFNKKQAEAENHHASLIEAFDKDYNAKKGYDAILFKNAGVYFNPALDITDEVIKGLNARYNKVSEK